MDTTAVDNWRKYSSALFKHARRLASSGRTPGEAAKVWRANNKAKVREYNKVRAPSMQALYRKRFRRAAPKWANKFFIEETYDLARLRTIHTGVKWHVDHIVPLNGAKVCGLHVETNLRVILAERNLAKGNSFPAC